MADALARLRPETEDAVLELAGLPDIVRGYEDVKLRNVERYRGTRRRSLRRDVDRFGFFKTGAALK